MQAKNGDTVRIHYTGKLDDGTEFDSSREGEPLEVTLGEGMLIAGFEQAVLGLAPGESKTVRIEPEEAYGEHSEELLLAVPRDQFPEHIEPQEGMLLTVNTEQGEMDVTIGEVAEDHVVLDANHPLAGQALTFDIELVCIV